MVDTGGPDPRPRARQPVKIARLARPELARSAAMFAALGDPTRLELVMRLSADDSQSITRLTLGLALSRQAVTKHLRVLARVGLARSSAAGRESRWSVDAARVGIARRYLDLVSATWDDRLKSLENHLAQPGR